jgi:hypothetical protein
LNHHFTNILNLFSPFHHQKTAQITITNFRFVLDKNPLKLGVKPSILGNSALFLPKVEIEVHNKFKSTNHHIFMAKITKSPTFFGANHHHHSFLESPNHQYFLSISPNHQLILALITNHQKYLSPPLYL